jgi:hypothetical protein
MEPNLMRSRSAVAEMSARNSRPSGAVALGIINGRLDVVIDVMAAYTEKAESTTM